jgi:hypothetical protein
MKQVDESTAEKISPRAIDDELISKLKVAHHTQMFRC